MFRLTVTYPIFSVLFFCAQWLFVAMIVGTGVLRCMRSGNSSGTSGSSSYDDEEGGNRHKDYDDDNDDDDEDSASDDDHGKSRGGGRSGSGSAYMPLRSNASSRRGLLK